MSEKVRKPGQAPEKGPGKYQKRFDPGEYRKRYNHGECQKSEIRASTEEGYGRVQGKGRIRASAGKVEIWASTRKGRIRASAEKVEIRASTRKVGSRRVPER